MNIARANRICLWDMDIVIEKHTVSWHVIYTIIYSTQPEPPISVLIKRIYQIGHQAVWMQRIFHNMLFFTNSLIDDKQAVLGSHEQILTIIEQGSQQFIMYIGSMYLIQHTSRRIIFHQFTLMVGNGNPIAIITNGVHLHT